MKKTLLLITLSIVTLSCGSDRNVTIRGTFSGLNGDTVVLEMLTAAESVIVDSTKTDRQGYYKFRVKLPENAPMFFNLICDGSIIPLIVSPGETVTVNSLCNLSCNYTVEGSDDSELLRGFNAQYKRGLSALDSLVSFHNELPQTDRNDSLKKTLLNQYLQEYYRIKREQIAFIISHPTSMAALFALYQRLPNDKWLFNERADLTYYQIVADSLGSRYPEAQRVKALHREVNERRKALELVQRIQEQADKSSGLPEIDLQDISGKSQKLSAYKGKWILIEFWSLTDQKYPIHNAELRELYEKYASKDLIIYQIALDGEKANWIDVVQQQRLPWISVYDPRGSAGIAAMCFNVHEVPANVLINPEGNIVDHHIFGERLESKLAELIP